MPGNPDPSHTVPASMPAYAVRSFSWTAVVVVAAAVCLVLGWHEEQAWARMSAVTLVMVAAVTLGITVLCLRQDAVLRSVRDVIENQAVLAYDMRRLVAYAERNLGATLDISGAVEEVGKRVEAMEENWRAALAEYFVDGVIQQEGLRLINGRDVASGNEGQRPSGPRR